MVAHGILYGTQHQVLVSLQLIQLQSSDDNLKLMRYVHAYTYQRVNTLNYSDMIQYTTQHNTTGSPNAHNGGNVHISVQLGPPTSMGGLHSYPEPML